MINDISELKYVKTIEIKGRSLLNRNSSGNYRFSHHSIQEFLVAKHLIENPELSLEKKLPMTILIAQMLIANSKFKVCQKFFDFDNTIFKHLDIRGPVLKVEDIGGEELKGADLKGADLREINLNGANLAGAELQVANLQGANLKDAVLDEAKLLGANLQRANLEGASFKMSDLSWADLKWANLKGARLNEADLQGAILHWANLLGTDLKGAVLNGTDFQGTMLNVTKLIDARLHGAVLQGLNFRGLNFTNTELNGTDLRGADLRKAKFQGANFEGADLSWADCQETDLQGAKFKGASFEGADLRRTNLQDADLSRTNLKEANTQGAKLDDAILHEADLSGITNISTEMLLKVRSLYQVKGLDPKIEIVLKTEKPTLFDEPPQVPLPEVTNDLISKDRYGKRQKIPPSKSSMGPKNTIKKIFISYSHSDKEFVNCITGELENAGMNVWVDEKKITVGDLISKKIEEGLSKCDFFCLVISRHSVKSNWVEREYRTALNAQLSSGTTPKILPLLIQDVELPMLLKDIKYADFSRDYNDGLKQLLKAINRWR